MFADLKGSPNTDEHAKSGELVLNALTQLVLLAELTGNQIIRGYVADVVARSSLVFFAQATTHSVCCAAAEHLEINDAIVGGDPAAVKNRMLKHLDDFADRSRQLPKPAKNFAELSDAFLKPK